MTLLVFFLRGGGLVSSSLFAIKTGFTAQEPQFYLGKHEVDRRSRLVTLKHKGYCWSGCYTVAESVGQQSFNSALGMAHCLFSWTWCEDARHLASMVWPVPACDSRAKGGGTASTSKPEASPSPRFWRALGASCRAPRPRPHPLYWRRRATLTVEQHLAAGLLCEEANVIIPN